MDLLEREREREREIELNKLTSGLENEETRLTGLRSGEAKFVALCAELTGKHRETRCAELGES